MRAGEHDAGHLDILTTTPESDVPASQIQFQLPGHNSALSAVTQANTFVQHAAWFLKRHGSNAKCTEHTLELH